VARGRDYRPGEQISYYITGTTKKVAAYENAKLASAFDSQNRDENIDYYIAKLDELVKKSGVVVPAAEQENVQL
jgi:DNA polymerase, archaea type